MDTVTGQRSTANRQGHTKRPGIRVTHCEPGLPRESETPGKTSPRALNPRGGGAACTIRHPNTQICKIPLATLPTAREPTKAEKMREGIIGEVGMKADNLTARVGIIGKADWV